jgi:hypothetical protein
VAVAERAKEGEKAQVTVYDLHTLKRRKVLQAVSADVQSREFVSLAFSPDSKNLITHGAAPDWSLIYWLWEKAKVGAVAKTSNPQGAAIYECSFNPIDNSVICVTGDGICRFLRITDNVLKPLQQAMGKREPQAYLCHAWMSEVRLLSTYLTYLPDLLTDPPNAFLERLGPEVSPARQWRQGAPRPYPRPPPPRPEAGCSTLRGAARVLPLVCRPGAPPLYLPYLPTLLSYLTD